jgi:putative hydrolase of the HAD superfamily
MADSIKAILFDIGGVLLTNGWDHHERRAVLEHFQVNVEEFESRHPDVYDAWERGRINLDDYLEATLFDAPKSFTKEEFYAAMRLQSREFEGCACGVLEELAADGRFLLGFLNNEARELNDFRLEHFGLNKLGKIFLSSCYVGLRKPEPAIFRLAIDVLQLPASSILFIDDRAGNVHSAANAGMIGIQYKTPQQLVADMESHGIVLSATEK